MAQNFCNGRIPVNKIRPARRLNFWGPSPQIPYRWVQSLRKRILRIVQIHCLIFCCLKIAKILKISNHLKTRRSSACLLRFWQKPLSSWRGCWSVIGKTWQHLFDWSYLGKVCCFEGRRYVWTYRWDFFLFWEKESVCYRFYRFLAVLRTCSRAARVLVRAAGILGTFHWRFGWASRSYLWRSVPCSFRSRFWSWPDI